MQNKWFTYSFLVVMVTALITLAILQYRWLGSVSEAEKERLKQGLDASIENFISDFNEVFEILKTTFQIQVSSTDPDWSEQLVQRYIDWKLNSSQVDLVEQVYVVRKKNDNGTPTFTISRLSDGMLKKVEPTKELENWLDDYYKTVSPDKPTQTLGNLPDFKMHSFIALPIKQMNMVQVKRTGVDVAGSDIHINLKVDLLDDMVVLDLNDQYIKEELIPSIAKKYFSESYEEQYHMAILKEGEPNEFYYNNSPETSFSEPEFSANLSRLNFTNLVFLENSLEKNIVSDFPVNDTFEFGFKTTFIDTVDELDDLVPIDQIRSINVISSSQSNIKVRKVDSGKVVSLNEDTSVSASFPSIFTSSDWQIWLDFKSGSLDAFVSKTRNRNLAISFGILGIMGVSVILIVVFTQRSRDLSEQQMLFVAGVSHELRTPITVIRTAAENLKEGVVQSEERRREYADLMLNEGRRLSEMVDQIMEFSGIQTGKRIYNFTEIDIDDLLNDVLREIKPVLEKQGMQLKFSNTFTKPTVYADRDALYLSISNLLHNAIKFSGDSKEISFTIDEVRPKNKYLAFIVRDYGIGIPLNEQKEIFKPFFRGKQTVQNQVKGNGIGLSLVKKVAEAHKGEIRLKSEVGTGSIFLLIIPISHE